MFSALEEFLFFTDDIAAVRSHPPKRIRIGFYGHSPELPAA